MRFYWLFIFCLFIPLDSPSLIADEINYTRDIQPILANHCYACHGPDQATREADLRLDIRDHAILELPSGEKATDLTEPVCPVSVRRQRPLCTCHTLSVLSEEPERMYLPSGEKATEFT